MWVSARTHLADACSGVFMPDCCVIVSGEKSGDSCAIAVKPVGRAAYTSCDTCVRTRGNLADNYKNLFGINSLRAYNRRVLVRSNRTGTAVFFPVPTVAGQLLLLVCCASPTEIRVPIHTHTYIIRNARM